MSGTAVCLQRLAVITPDNDCTDVTSCSCAAEKKRHVMEEGKMLFVIKEMSVKKRSLFHWELWPEMSDKSEQRDFLN